MGKFNDLTGQRFGRLVATSYTPDRRRTGGAEGAWTVQCDCGKYSAVRPYLLKSGKQQSCGCLRNELARARVRTHGKTNTFEFNVWTAMRRRCQYVKHPKYHLYGGRGITVCSEWSAFETFYVDMGKCPFPKGSIERLNNDIGYQPDNCIWLLKSQQSKNRRCCDGQETPRLQERSSV